MRRLVTSDLQLMYGERDQYRTDFFTIALPQLIDKYKPNQLIFCGDICEEKDNHPAPLVNTIANGFFELQKKCKVIILEGNHDFLHKEHPYFKFVTAFDNIEWISKPTVLDNCLYLPHTRDYKKDWKDLKFDGWTFTFAHNIFDGVKANGQKLSGIPTNIFPDDAQVISGDVHEPQELDNGKIIYVGSPCLCDYGDDYQPRILLLDDLKIKSIKVYGQQKRLINWDWARMRPETFVGVTGVNQGDLLKVRVQLEMKDVANWADIRQQIETWAAKNKFLLNVIVPEISYVIGERQKVVDSNKKSDVQYFDSFIKRTGVDIKTAEVGKEIIDGF